MMATKSVSKFPVSLLLALACASFVVQAQSVLQQTQSTLNDLQRFEATLVEQESEFGPFDLRLTETLLSIERLHKDLGNQEAVKEVQLRRLQLLRTAEGLENPAVIPILEEIVRTEIALGNWQEVSDHLEHIRAVVSSNYGAESEQSLHAMERQAAWLQTMVYLGRSQDRAENILDARDLYDDMLDIAEELYGEESPALIPWYNKRAYTLYQQVDMLNANSSITTDAIDETIQRDGQGRLISASRGRLVSSFSINNRLPITNDGEPVGVGYLRQAAGYIDDIIDIAEAEADWETWAMATLYHGDYSILQGRNIGRRDYRDARDKLLELGIGEARLESFFNKPMPIPVERFYRRFSELEAYQMAGIGELHAEVDDDDDIDDPWDEPVHAGEFRAWQEGLRSTPMPTVTDPLLATNLPFDRVDLKFRVSSNGRVSGVDVLALEPDSSRARGRTVRAARNLHFRPALFGERTRSRRHVQLRYWILSEDN